MKSDMRVYLSAETLNIKYRSRAFSARFNGVMLLTSVKESYEHFESRKEPGAAFVPFPHLVFRTSAEIRAK